jgi:hypothetical protein
MLTYTVRQDETVPASYNSSVGVGSSVAPPRCPPRGEAWQLNKVGQDGDTPKAP